MREIKFRVPIYSFATGKFLRFAYWQAAHLCFISPSGVSSNDNVYHDDEQYSGLHDKNGKEIYEGDIVHCWYYDSEDNYGEYYGIIIFYVGRFSCGYNKISESCEVLGNIHENPELLK